MTPFQSILVALDGSRESEHVLSFAAAMAWRRPGTRLRLVEFVEDRKPREAHETRLARACARLTELGLAVDWQVEQGTSVVTSLLHAAEEAGAELIMLTGHGRSGLERWLLGSVSEDLARASEVPVFLCKPGQKAGGRFEHVLLALDGTEFSERALAPLTRLVRAHDARLTLATVCSTPLGHEKPVAAWEHLCGISRSLETSGLSCEPQLAFGEPAPALLRLVKERQCDLVVIPSHGRRGKDRFWLGSVAESVFRQASCPTLIWKGQGVDG